MSTTSFFALRQWQFVNANFIPLLDQLSVLDRQTFNFDVREIDWQIYVEDYCMGIRRYILNEQEETIPAARTSLMKLYVEEDHPRPYHSSVGFHCVQTVLKTFIYILYCI